MPSSWYHIDPWRKDSLVFLTLFTINSENRLNKRTVNLRLIQRFKLLLHTKFYPDIAWKSSVRVNKRNQSLLSAIVRKQQQQVTSPIMYSEVNISCVMHLIQNLYRYRSNQYDDQGKQSILFSSLRVCLHRGHFRHIFRPSHMCPTEPISSYINQYRSVYLRDNENLFLICSPWKRC